MESFASPVSDAIELTHQLSASFLAGGDPAAVLDRVRSSLSDVGKLANADIVSVFLEHHERQVVERVGTWVKPQLQQEADPSGDDIAVDDAVKRALNQTLIVHDLVAANEAGAHLLKAGGGSSFLSVPFQARTDRCILALLRCGPQRVWSTVDTQLAADVAKLYGRAMTVALSEELLALIYDQGPIGFSVRSFSGLMLDHNTQYLETLGLTEEGARAGNLRELVHPDDREAVRMQVDRLRSGSALEVRFETRIIGADQTWRWVRVSSHRVDTPGSGEHRILTAVEDTHQAHTDHVKLEYAASHDQLTDVANRAAMREMIYGLEVKNCALPSVLAIDLDRFKLVNDSMGHLVGDQVLTAVASRLVEQVRDVDLVARLGGDEFAVVVPDTGPEGVYLLAERLRRCVEEPLIIEGRRIAQTISIGVAIGEECASTAELLVRADRALYAAKEQGRNIHVVFDQSMREQSQADTEMERDLRHAIDQDQLMVYFQPEFSIPDRMIVGAEALLRWQHPILGVVPAAFFIGVAERSGMIDDIGRFALREGCRAFGEIADSVSRPLQLRVNISGREFNRPELPDLVRAALAESRLAPDHLCLEMTETTLMASPEVVLETLRRLHELGVEFAIDDFGTGFSSLTYLKQFPVDALKIDASFVEDLETNTDSRAIIESIIGLGEALSLEIVAEGIETETQLELLHELGCTRAQGYLVAPAVSVTDFIRLLSC